MNVLRSAIRAATLAALAAACFFRPAAAAEPIHDALLREHLWREIRAMPPGQRPKVGVALSGGGFRGGAHLGVLQVLDEAGFPVDVVAGTSMGAIIGSIYSSGMPMPKLLELRHALHFGTGTDLSSYRLLQLVLADQLMSTKKMERFIRETIGDKTFDQLAKPFACVAMDIKTGEPIIFREGPVAPAVRASMTLPGLFAPVEYRHRYLVDGGVVDYIPVNAAKLLGAQWVLASVTEGDYTKTQLTNVLFALQQVIDIRGALLAQEERRQADIAVDSPVGDIHFYQSWRVDEAMRKGRMAMKAKLFEAQRSLIVQALPQLWKLWLQPR
ncbi:MAG: patatin-like phospholipase family protein [Elusimicrobia bacterium]|nr:patatin-like phospholipase family protein [Elusimicrobiota bacterium]